MRRRLAAEERTRRKREGKRDKKEDGVETGNMGRTSMISGVIMGRTWANVLLQEGGQSEAAQIIFFR